MTQTGYSNAIVNAMLGWLKGLASWVLKLFNLSGGFSPLKFLADNWLQMLIILLIVGVLADLLVWLIRWRPHWVWFRKKRVIINDKNFFAREKYIRSDEDLDPEPPKKPSTYIKPRRDWEDNDFVVRTAASRKNQDHARRNRHVKSMQLGKQERTANRDVFQDDLFNVNAKQKFSDKYEDEVFNVSSLPGPDRRKAESRPPRRSEIKSVEKTVRNKKKKR